MTAEAPGGARTLRPSAFHLGLVAGIALVAAGAGAMWWVEPSYNVDLAASGAAVSRQGGTVIMVSRESGVLLRQTCIEGCDDLRIRAKSGDDSFGMSAYSAAGECLACDSSVYVTSGATTRLRLAGEQRLRLTSEPPPRP